MTTMTRREAREEVFRLLFETEFHGDMPPEEIYSLAVEAREFKDPGYIRRVYLGVREKLPEIDETIARHSNGWRTDRIAPVSRNIMRLCVYEMQNVADVPPAVALNEAVELAKQFDEEKARPFINGVLNSVKNELEHNKANTEIPE